MTSDVFSSLNELERDSIFFHKVSQYNMDKIHSDRKPNTFEVIRLWYYHNKNPKTDDVSNFCTAFEHNKQIKDNSITEALSKFTSKHDFYGNRAKYFIELNNKERKQYLKKDEPELSIHHVIPLNILEAFFKNYYEIQDKQEQKLMFSHTDAVAPSALPRHDSRVDTAQRCGEAASTRLGNAPRCKFNWYKIISHNQRKLLLNTLKHQYTDYHKYLRDLIDEDSNGEGPSTLEQKTLKKAEKPAYLLEDDADYSDFMDMMLSLPPGLSFRGPSSGIRSDDPDENFEANCAIILGQEYFNKVQNLFKQIENFNEQYRLTTDKQNEDLTLEAAQIFNRITTIHLEPGAQIIFDYDPAHWIQIDRRWRIKNDNEWSAWLRSTDYLIKEIARQQDRDRIRVLSISGGLISDVHYNRRKREHGSTEKDLAISLEKLKNECNIDNEVPKLPERPVASPRAPPARFCYSKPYYMYMCTAAFITTIKQSTFHYQTGNEI
jgi:hypothetical protein